MKYFTDSPFERMMMETPSGRHETEDLPPSHPCWGMRVLQRGNLRRYLLAGIFKSKYKRDQWVTECPPLHIK